MTIDSVLGYWAILRHDGFTCWGATHRGILREFAGHCASCAHGRDLDEMGGPIRASIIDTDEDLFAEDIYSRTVIRCVGCDNVILAAEWADTDEEG